MTTMYGLTRATSTLIGAAIAGLLLWLATMVAGESLGAYWAFVGLIAAAGLVMAVSQLVGGWTKWGTPAISLPVLLLGFLPVLVAGGIVLLAAQPTDGAWGVGWGEAVGLGWLVGDLTAVFPAIAFAIGLTFGYSFDTSGSRRHVDEVVHTRDDVTDRDDHVTHRDDHVTHRDDDVTHRDDHVADAPTTAERQHVGTGRPHTVTVGPEHDDQLVASGSTGHGDSAPPRRRRLFNR